MNIKIKMTFKLLLSMVLVFYITISVYIILNVMIFNNKLTFGSGLFNLSFSPGDFIEEYLDDLSQGYTLNLEQDKIDTLINNNIWLQVLDEDNNEAYAVNKPNDIPNSYLVPDLIQFIEHPWQSDAPTTISTRNIIKGDKQYTLLIGFPISELSTVRFTYTKDFLKYHQLIVVFALVLMTLITYLFSRSIVKPMVSVVNDIEDLKSGIYSIKKEKKGVYKEVSKNINDLSLVLKENEVERKEIDKAKEQWIANIGHDLKTPLSSIKGYAELLKGDVYDINIDDAKRYGGIILSTSNYIEELVNDLSLVYKLKNKVLPFKFKEEDMVLLIQNIVIEILNNSKYSEREINFEYKEKEKINFKCDKKYIKRALNNFIVNALEHNPEDTVVEISLAKTKAGIEIVIKDNGQGIEEEELKHIFQRYYRGEKNNSLQNGSGLGMAIAKEVIDGHDGVIKIESEVSVGTIIRISFKDAKKYLE